MSDPIRFVHRYSTRADREIVAFLASALAYGRIPQIEKDLNELFARMGESPYSFVKNFSKPDRQRLKSFKHRFNTGDDISDLLELLKTVLGRYSSIENFFVKGYNPYDKNIIPALSGFCDSLLDIYIKTHDGCPSKGLGYLLPSPSAGSACKRLNLFLRWMVRGDNVDLGLWKTIDKSKLIVPVDVHLARISGLLGFCRRKTVSLASAIEITAGFTEIEPADPVKYDFALNRLATLRKCTGRHQSGCQFCELFGFCFRN